MNMIYCSTDFMSSKSQMHKFLRHTLDNAKFGAIVNL